MFNKKCKYIRNVNIVTKNGQNISEKWKTDAKISLKDIDKCDDEQKIQLKYIENVTKNTKRKTG